MVLFLASIDVADQWVESSAMEMDTDTATFTEGIGRLLDCRRIVRNRIS